MAKQQSKSGGSGVNLGIIQSVNESAGKEVKALEALIARAQKRPPVPRPADAADEPLDDLLAAHVTRLEKRTAELGTALVRSRDAVGAATAARKLTKADLADGREKLGLSYEIFLPLAKLHPETYGVAFGHGFPHQTLSDLGTSEADLQKAVTRVHQAIEELPAKERGTLQELLVPLAKLDARFQAGAGTHQAAYDDLVRAQARAARAERVLRRATELQYVDAPELAHKVFPAAPHAKATPAPKPAPAP
jgi:hypothetical protein